MLHTQYPLVFGKAWRQCSLDLLDSVPQSKSSDFQILVQVLSLGLCGGHGFNVAALGIS